MKANIALIVAVVAVIIAVYATAQQVNFGAVNGDSTSYQNLVLQTYSGATSTLSVGCIQALATSSATTIKITPIASSTQIASGYNGYLLWQYGTCP